MAWQKELKNIANILRRDSIRMTTEAGSGHPTSCMSCAEIMASLFFKEMAYDAKNPENPNNDEFVLSKGHAAPILYACLYHAGAIKEDLLSLRKIDSPLEGHPMPGSLKGVKVATGSLGQGLSAGLGMALAAKLSGRKYKTYVLLGDSEMAEGSVYEAMQTAPYYNLDNLIAILDANRLGQSTETMVGHNVKEYKKRFDAFGWETVIVNGHSVKEILAALEKAKKSKKPFAVIAKTFKGKGVSFLENREGWHGKPVPKERLEEALGEIPKPEMPSVKIRVPAHPKTKEPRTEKMVFTPYEKGTMVASRSGYGSGLASLAQANERVIAIDAEVGNSTYSEKVKKTAEKQFVETFIQEQNMIGMALGMSAKGFKPYASTFAAFLSRAHDQIRMAALSKADICICGSHAGVSIGEDGASQMGLEDIALFRALPDSTVFYPSDAVSAEKMVEQCLRLPGIKYIRTTRGKTPVIYSNKDEFPANDFKVVRESANDSVVLAGAGITLHEALKAHEELKKQGVNSAVVDLYCVKPFNAKKFSEFAEKHGSKVVIAEDQYKEGGMGEMVCAALAGNGIRIKTLSIGEIPHSGKPGELLHKYGVDSEAIAKTAKGF